MPFCMFTDPELGRVGRNEIEAKGDKIEYRVAKLPMANVLRTVTIAEPRGFMKMLIDKESNKIVGFTAFGIEAKRTDGGRSYRDGRAPAVHRVARCDLRSSDNV